MATLEKIRNRAGIGITIFIGLALAAFVLGDAVQSGSSIMRGNQQEIAKIAGKSVDYKEFQKKVDDLSDIYKMNSGSTSLDQKTTEQIREQTWMSMVRNITMKDIYENLGIAVTSNELFELVQGENPHAIIQSLFRDQKTGTINRAALIQFLKYQQSNTNGPEHNYWLFVENQIQEERSFAKYNNLLSKGIYTTNDEAKLNLEGKNKKVNIEYVGKLYSSVSDSSVRVSTAELEAYYEAHKEKYKQEASREIEYILFPVVASKGDEDKVIKWINDIKPEFATVEDPAAYVNINSDKQFDPAFYKKSDLPANISEFAFAGKAGDIYGPYKEGQSWKLCKIQKFEELPDSVNARHILIRVTSQAETAKAKSTADSLKRVLTLGGDFAALARKYSGDEGSAVKGGELGWFKRGMMVKPFDDAAFFGKVNDYQVVSSQFGIHLIQVLKRGNTTMNVQLATIVRNIEPSSQTYQQTYSQASKFASENRDLKAFRAAVTAQGLNKRLASLYEADKEVAGLENSRLLVRATFKAELEKPVLSTEGTPIFELGSQFVVAHLSGIQEKGYSSLSVNKPTIEMTIRKDKKAEHLKAKMSGKTDLTSLASSVGSKVEQAQDINFETYSIPGLGAEPSIAGVSSALEPGGVSKPVSGSNGVYVVKATAVNKAMGSDLAAEKYQAKMALGYRISVQAFDALRENAGVVDKRAKFY
ncbi:MAG: SurA N-terminal domain-containing protein [Prolixibacteraceae bacterium]|jgi:peptidyl-prolyl cis-trans isomerase D|nr:SurA N-terminal domain-containing protein [Prolixibacteraceae bacterium]